MAFSSHRRSSTLRATFSSFLSALPSHVVSARRLEQLHPSTPQDAIATSASIGSSSSSSPHDSYDAVRARCAASELAPALCVRVSSKRSSSVATSPLICVVVNKRIERVNKRIEETKE